MGLLSNRNEKVVVTKGYLMAFGGMLLMMAGVGIDQSEIMPSWASLGVVAVGLAVLVLCFPHLMTKPQPLHDDRPEPEG
ncbi:hypothetical protein [Erythrobacter sp. THAF29]|uniref:hypothetical protein n=1 Tax=Erythrobacter sp. THAF29 TaxID=2587851 RepID=UPI001268E441|nr:hypothetical protein [Erythrobacter sp. THAF29]QFT76063.1 hypothetical protein FIU90_00775 [Erythrobacter sp. THAF29]